MFFLLPAEIAEGIAPQHRFMSAYEQNLEPPNRILPLSSTLMFLLLPTEIERE
jgi:hypothetical protein